MSTTYIRYPQTGGSGSSGIVSINTDTTPAQTITAGTGISVTTSSGNTTITNTETSASTAIPNTYYVNPAIGNDTSGTGSQALPFATIGKACTVMGSASSNAAFNDPTQSFYKIVAIGTFTENPTIGTRPNVVLDLTQGQLIGNLTISFNQGAIGGSGNQSPQYSIIGSTLQGENAPYTGIYGNIECVTPGTFGSLLWNLYISNLLVYGNISLTASTNTSISTLGLSLSQFSMYGSIVCSGTTNGGITLKAYDCASSDYTSLGALGVTGAVNLYDLQSVAFDGPIVLSSVNVGQPRRWINVHFKPGQASDFSAQTWTIPADSISIADFKANVPTPGTQTFTLLDNALGVNYSPATPGNWSPTPSQVNTALDQLAASIAGGSVTSVTASSPLASSGGTTPNISLTGTVSAAHGGTGISTSSSTGVPVISSGTWSVDSDLPVSLGGTGSNTLTQYGSLVGNGTGALIVTAVGLSGGVLISEGGAAAPVFGQLPLSNTNSTSGQLPAGAGGTGIDTHLSTGVPVISSGTWSVDSTLPVSLGGTGQGSTLNANGVIYASSTTAMASTTVGTAGQLLTSNGSGSAPTMQTLSGNTAVLKVPTQQLFTSSTGTYTTPTSPSPLYIRVQLVGGGGGGGSSGTSGNNAGSGGGNTTFGTSLLSGSGGGGGYSSAGGTGTGGSASLGSGPVGTALTGGSGGEPIGSSSITNIAGGMGAASPFGGAGGGVNSGTSLAGITNTGSGGGGAGTGGTSSSFAGGGGGAGGYVDAIISSPAATYSYAVGASGGGGTAGTSGNAGGAGGSGIIIVHEYYQ
jgi:hypothetical protein